MKNPKNRPPSKVNDKILLAIDAHADYLQVARQLDSCVQPSQRLREAHFLPFAQKQLALGKKVYAVYEAGPFGFGLARKLLAMGVEAYVMRPKKLDPYAKGVCTDKTDAREMLQDLDRYVGGNKRALCVVHIPTVEQEYKRAVSRQRDAFKKDLLRTAARGRSLLLTFGLRTSNHWWKPLHWEGLQVKVAPPVQALLERYRTIILGLQEQIKPVEKELVAAAPKSLPRGMGALTFEILLREILQGGRFAHRRQVGSFTGLCGGVSSSGQYHADLKITKHGHARIRTLLIELAWRMVRYQSQSPLIKKWLPGLASSKARRKQAIVAIGRQLAVDIWKWQTGRVKPQDLGWSMVTAD